MVCSKGCPTLDKKDWELKKHIWKNKAFYVTKFFVFLHMPIGISAAIQKGWNELNKKGYKVSSPFIMLQEETSPFTARMLIMLDKVPKKKDSNIEIWRNVTLYSKFYKGGFKGLGSAVTELMDYVAKKIKKQFKCIYTWTANCPECWKTEQPVNVIFASINNFKK
jgi:hypothetical protein